MKSDGGPAFPYDPAHRPRAGEFSRGMSLRDWFAGQALAGLLASWPHDCENPGIAHDVYRFADAMLKARDTE